MSLTESFIYCYQLHGIKYFIKHLQDELIKYKNEGLRQDYIDKHIPHLSQLHAQASKSVTVAIVE